MIDKEVAEVDVVIGGVTVAVTVANVGDETDVIVVSESDVVKR